MRVPVYQQQVTPQIPVERSQVTVPEGAAGVAVKPVDTTQGLVQGVESLRLGLVKLNENREKFMLASAVNDYRRQNTEFLHAKDTGIFAKKGKNVFGATQQYDEFSSKAMEDIAKRYKMSGVARDRFVEATSALYNASLSSVMTHEQRETDAAQQMEWKTMINDSLNAVALSYNDDAVCEENWRIMAGAIVQQNEQYGDQVVQSKLAEARSQLQIARLAPMLEDNPKAADAFLKAHLNEFTGEDRLKAQKAVDNKMEVIKVQEETDRIVKRFGGNEAAALKFIHAKFEGPMENHLAASVKTRYSELKIKSYSASSARAAQVGANFKSIKQDIIKNGTQYNPDDLRKVLPEDKVTELMAVMEEQLSYKKAKARAERDPSYAAATQEEQDRMIRREMRVPERVYLSNVQSIWQRVVAREADEDDIKGWVANGTLSRRLGNDLSTMIKNLTAQNANVLKNETKFLTDSFKAVAGNDGLTPDMEKAMAEFQMEAVNIDPKSRDYKTQVTELKVEKFKSGLKGMPTERLFSSPFYRSYTRAGQALNAAAGVNPAAVANYDYVMPKSMEAHQSAVNSMLGGQVRMPAKKTANDYIDDVAGTAGGSIGPDLPDFASNPMASAPSRRAPGKITKTREEQKAEVREGLNLNKREGGAK